MNAITDSLSLGSCAEKKPKIPPTPFACIQPNCRPTSRTEPSASTSASSPAMGRPPADSAPVESMHEP